jgi:hypothetical protein
VTPIRNRVAAAEGNANAGVITSSRPTGLNTQENVELVIYPGQFHYSLNQVNCNLFSEARIFRKKIALVAEVLSR